MYARCPDSGGYQFYWNAMQTGTTPAVVAAGLVYSTEFDSKQGPKVSALLSGQTYWSGINIINPPVPPSIFVPGVSAAWFGQSPGGSETVHQGDYNYYRVDFSDLEGSAAMNLVGATIGLGSGYSGNCSIQYLPGTRQLSVLDAQGRVYASATIGQGGILAGPYCSVYSTLSSASSPGTTLSLFLSVAFNSAGNFSVYGWAQALNGVVSGPVLPVSGALTVQAYLTTLVSPAGSGTISPSSGWYNPGVVSIAATPNSGYIFSSFSGALSGTTNPQNLAIIGSAVVTANFAAIPQPLTLPAGLKGINYFPRGHAWFSMLYDWYTQDCTTSTELGSCTSGSTVAQVVATDLAKLKLDGFNLIHLYLYDQDIVQTTFQNYALATSLTAPGFVGWDNGGPQNSPGQPNGPHDSGHNQWTALAEFASLAKQNGIWIMLDFAAFRPSREMALSQCGHTVCNGANCANFSYPPNSSCPSGYACSSFTNAAVGCNYAAWVSSFIDYLAPYQNVLVWGLNWSLGPGPQDPFWQTSCGTTGQNAYQQILSHLQQHPYGSPSGRALIAVDDVVIAGTADPDTPACTTLSTNTKPQLGFYPSNWQDAQKKAYAWQNLPSSEPAPDLYSVELYNANAGDLQAALECVLGTPNQTCPATRATCNSSILQCPIPASKIFVTEFATGSSFEGSPIGNATAGYGDEQTPTTTATGQAQWITQTLCAMNHAGVRNTGYFGYYDAYSWWARNYSYNASQLAWLGFWGLKSELPSAYNPASDGQKPSWSAMSTFNPNACPGAGVAPTPVVAMLPPDGAIPSAGANPYYTIGDTANVYYSAANVTSLSMTTTPGSLLPQSFMSCDQTPALLELGSTVVGSCGFAVFNRMASAGSGFFTLSGSNNDADGAPAGVSTPAPQISTPVTVGLSPIISGLVDFNTGQQCNLTINPACVLAVSQLDTIEIFGAGFNPIPPVGIRLLWRATTCSLETGTTSGTLPVDR